MSTGKKDIDPTTELVEEEDEQSLPEEEQDSAIDLAADAGSLAVGRGTIVRYLKLALISGVYRMIDAKAEVLYVGKAKNIRKRSRPMSPCGLRPPASSG